MSGEQRAEIMEQEQWEVRGFKGGKRVTEHMKVEKGLTHLGRGSAGRRLEVGRAMGERKSLNTHMNML